MNKYEQKTEQFDVSRLNFHHLHYFWRVAKSGHLSRTAEELHISQSALSAQIRQLEERLGEPLFLREGRRLQSAVQTGWDRARRTILVSDGVNFLAAAVLYVLASSNVRGFAFMLMLTTILDVLVTFLFTHPLLSILSHTKFFGEGHKWSGFDRETLGAQPRYRGRGRVTIADRKHAGATPATAGATAEGSRA